MNCWICGNQAESGEHEIKASDLKLVFGTVDQKNPILWYSSGKGFNKVGSFKSDYFKFPDLICKKCNNELTQPYDRAWEIFSKTINQELSDKLSHGKLNLNYLFPDKDKDKLIRHVQLFFVKIFGCFMLKGGVPVDLSRMAENLRNDVESNHLYLIITKIPSKEPSVGLSDIRTLQKKGVTVLACFLYMVGEIVIGIYYDPMKMDRKTIRKAVHPRNHGMKINYFVKKIIIG